MSKFQPPPTWALPVIVDKTTKEGFFSPVWLKWFVDLSGALSADAGYAGGTTTQVLHGNGPTWGAVVEEDITLASVVTNNVTTVRHGFVPTLSGNVLTFFNGTGTYTTAGLSHFTEALSTAAPNATVPVASLTATNAAVNVDAAFGPKGAGALTAQVADNTVAGGTKRGAYAVDWQLFRNGNSKVAGGDYSTVSGGDSNSAPAVHATASGGFQNNAGGGYSVASGGRQNSATNSYSTVCGGYVNISSGANSTIGGGIANTAGGTSSVVSGGESNSSSGLYSTVGGGHENLADGAYSAVSGGYRASTNGIYGKYAYASGQFVLVGDCQRGSLTLRNTTTDATATVLTSNSAAALATNQLFLNSKQAMIVRGQLLCRRSVAQADEAAGWEFTCVVTRGAGPATTVLVAAATITSIANNITGLAATPFTVTADITYGALAVTVTGVAATNLRWLCTVTTSEVQYS